MPCDLLDTKFRSASYKKDAIAQKQDEVSKAGNAKQADLSGRIWRRINPSYIPDDFSTTNQSQQKYDDDDFSPDKANFRVRDRHTEYVEYLVRDQALARVGKS